ncbi:MAG: hypothetical protein AB7L28_22510 [Kofleriaceae bacterium]
MADLIQKGLAWLDDQRHAHMTQTVLYVRDTENASYIVELLATIGRTEFEQVDEFGIVHKLQSRDFLIRAEDLVLNSELTLPKAGDRVRETVGAQTFVYELMAPGGEPPWRYSDPYRKALRIHTKHVATE